MMLLMTDIFYAVKTTGIFCRPSCKSRVPKEKTLAFENTKQALAANFVPANGASQPGKECLMKSGLPS